MSEDIRGRMGNYVRTIRQKMAAGSNFNGSEPMVGASEAVPVYKNGQLEYSDLTAGGIFAFPPTIGALEVKRLAFDLGNATTWTLSVQVLQLDGSYIEFPIYDQDDFPGAKVFFADRTITILQPGDRLALTTSGGTQAMSVEIDSSKWA